MAYSPKRYIAYRSVIYSLTLSALLGVHTHAIGAKLLLPLGAASQDRDDVMSLGFDTCYTTSHRLSIGN